MTRLEMVEKIKEKTGVTYEEARLTLEKNNWDLLDSIVALERERPLDGEEEPAAEEKQEQTQKKSAPKRVVKRAGTGEVGDKIATALKWVSLLLKKGEENRVQVLRKDEEVMSISLTTTVLLFLLSWWIPLLLVVAGLFTGYKFRFIGSGIASRVVNSASEKASEKADELKNKMNEQDT